MGPIEKTVYKKVLLSSNNLYAQANTLLPHSIYHLALYFLPIHINENLNRASKHQTW